MNWLKSGLSRRFAVVMGVVALLPVLLLYQRVLKSSEIGIRGAVLELHRKLAERGAERIQGWVEAVDGRVQVALLALDSLDEAGRRSLLKRLVASDAGVASFALIGRDGRVLLSVSNPALAASAALEPGIAKAALLRAIAKGGRTAMIARAASGALLVLHYPFGKGVYARAVLPMQQATRLFAANVGATGFAILVDRTGRPLIAPEGHDLAGIEGWPITREALRPDSTVGTSEFVDGAGTHYVGAYAAVPTLGGAVLVLQPRQEAYLALDETQRAAGFAILVVIVGALCVSALLARLLSAPVLALTRAAEAVSQGDFEARVDIATGDELQQLAVTFNAMAERLRQYSLLQVDRLVVEQRRVEAVLFSIDEGIVMTDRDGRVQLVNRRGREMFELASDWEFEGRPISEAFPEGPLRTALLAAHEKPGEFKEVNLSTEQDRRFVRAIARAVVSPGRETELGTVFALRDVTLERELDRMKEDFLHYITHDLRNPLSSASGFLDVLMKGTAGVLNSDQMAIVSSVRRSTARLMGMINNILDIAKMEAGRMRVQLRTVSLAGIASRSIEMLEQFAKAKKVTVQLAAVEEFSLEADADMIERVFMNLVGNAVKYTPEGGTITISIMDEGAAIRCCVEDSGEGIPSESLGRVFEKFEQVQGRRRGGTGLGLTITRFFLESHLGKIWVESELGHGARFYFTIPKGLVAEADGTLRIIEPTPDRA
jgi:signal transduction histidine kinase